MFEFELNMTFIEKLNIWVLFYLGINLYYLEMLVLKIFLYFIFDVVY